MDDTNGVINESFVQVTVWPKDELPEVMGYVTLGCVVGCGCNVLPDTDCDGGSGGQSSTTLADFFADDPRGIYSERPLRLPGNKLNMFGVDEKAEAEFMRDFYIDYYGAIFDK